MDTFVGAEYIIANALIALSKKGYDSITFNKLRTIGVQIQQYCNENGIDAVILTSGDKISAAIYDFSDYFEYAETETPVREPMIRIRKNIPITQLKSRFIGYLPLEVIDVLMRKIPEFVA